MKNDMDYETALALKKAGYPMIEVLVDHRNCLYCGTPFIPIDGKNYHEPRLEELIEAVGERFGRLEQVAVGKWNVTQHTDFSPPSMLCRGETATEAIAKLWLALHSSTKGI